jgi:hypothetical protein
MSIRTKVVAGLLTAGIAVTGVTAAAWADTTPTTTANPPASATVKGCKNASQRVDRLQGRVTKLEAVADRLQKAHDQAVDRHHPARAAKLQARIDKIHQRAGTVRARMQKVEQRCNVRPSSPTTSTTTAPGTTK